MEDRGSRIEDRKSRSSILDLLSSINNASMLADLIKIHCLTHGATFPMSRTSRTVVCKEGNEEHTLSTNFPNQGLWVYCCNCQTFIAWDAARKEASVKECPFCLSSLNPRAYCCDHCAITMVDYDDQTLRKQHMVLSWGAPQPACAGCHHFPGATPKNHFCETLQCNLSSARQDCPFCGLSISYAMRNGSKLGVAPVIPSIAESDVLLAEAKAHAREAEERIRLAEATARKEIELRVRAERRVEEVERKITRDLVMPQTATLEPDWARREAEIARANAEAEIQARREAEARVQEAEELRKQAESAVRREAEMRQMAEQKARELAENYSSAPRKDKITIALYASLAGVLSILLLLLIVTMIRMSSN
ncbi:MAG: hypothetical protein ACREEM_24710 [Blastocatellia bacterium]